MNHHRRMQICSLVTLSMIALAMGRKILSEKPDFLNPCSITDPSFSNCFGKTVENIHTIWRNGVPGLKSVSSIDPMFVKRIGINQDLNNPISINLNLNNVTLTGLSDIKARESRFETKPLGVMVKMGLKKLAVNGGYDINGHIFTMPVGGKGTATISVESAVARVGILFKLAEDRGYTFTTVDDLRLDLQEVRGVYLNLDGADSSQENAILNSYGDAIFEILRPTLNEVLSKLFKDRWTKIFNYVPANYVFADLPGVKA